ncbi:uncharacterized protein LOC128167739 isoform X1 [Crassostrea angulata]|uniref:uncharacterized protein LOC128167739 isoform X1 n=2 Tax=Magallana angulata TaxID=2784310 RepID=UPI0022B16B40|nr:uncharacterized protein LOC128167739 isoform X1 [Crassostrea angulata]
MWPNFYVTFSYINEQGSYMDSVKQLKLRKTFDLIMQRFLCLVLLSVVCVATTSGNRYCQKYEILRQSSRVSNWEEANNECQRKRMSLVKVDNMEEDAFLRTFLDKENPGYNADGWFIGGKYSNGRWTWSDGSPMVYQNFPGGNRFTSMAQDVTNYAFIMKNGYAWGYVSPFGTQRMGYICENTRC